MHSPLFVKLHKGFIERKFKKQLSRPRIQELLISSGIPEKFHATLTLQELLIFRTAQKGQKQSVGSQGQSHGLPDSSPPSRSDEPVISQPEDQLGVSGRSIEDLRSNNIPINYRALSDNPPIPGDCQVPGNLQHSKKQGDLPLQGLSWNFGNNNKRKSPRSARPSPLRSYTTPSTYSTASNNSSIPGPSQVPGNLQHSKKQGDLPLQGLSWNFGNNNKMQSTRSAPATPLRSNTTPSTYSTASNNSSIPGPSQVPGNLQHSKKQEDLPLQGLSWNFGNNNKMQSTRSTLATPPGSNTTPSIYNTASNNSSIPGPSQVPGNLQHSKKQEDLPLQGLSWNFGYNNKMQSPRSAPATPLRSNTTPSTYSTASNNSSIPGPSQVPGNLQHSKKQGDLPLQGLSWNFGNNNKMQSTRSARATPLRSNTTPSTYNTPSNNSAIPGPSQVPGNLQHSKQPGDLPLQGLSWNFGNNNKMQSPRSARATHPGSNTTPSTYSAPSNNSAIPGPSQVPGTLQHSKQPGDLPLQGLSWNFGNNNKMQSPRSARATHPGSNTTPSTYSAPSNNSAIPGPSQVPGTLQHSKQPGDLPLQGLSWNFGNNNKMQSPRSARATPPGSNTTPSTYSAPSNNSSIPGNSQVPGNLQHSKKQEDLPLQGLSWNFGNNNKMQSPRSARATPPGSNTTPSTYSAPSNNSSIPGNSQVPGNLQHSKKQGDLPLQGLSWNFGNNNKMQSTRSTLATPPRSNTTPSTYSTPSNNSAIAGHYQVPGNLQHSKKQGDLPLQGLSWNFGNNNKMQSTRSTLATPRRSNTTPSTYSTPSNNSAIAGHYQVPGNLQHSKKQGDLPLQGLSWNFGNNNKMQSTRSTLATPLKSNTAPITSSRPSNNAPIPGHSQVPGTLQHSKKQGDLPLQGLSWNFGNNNKMQSTRSTLATPPGSNTTPSTSSRPSNNSSIPGPSQVPGTLQHSTQPGDLPLQGLSWNFGRKNETQSPRSAPKTPNPARPPQLYHNAPLAPQESSQKRRKLNNGMIDRPQPQLVYMARPAAARDSSTTASYLTPTGMDY
ncbi:hypothetical protein BZA77DRAFT_356592 [Pyronema omphalodes]|nr:hypothetical protein BZA77DRAFT_356592 [Pyronema omphalodes]